MFWRENECVGCDLPCIHDACQYYNVEHYACDECGCEFDPNDLYDYYNQCLCEECLLAHFDKYNFNEV